MRARIGGWRGWLRFVHEEAAKRSSELIRGVLLAWAHPCGPLCGGARAGCGEAVGFIRVVVGVVRLGHFL